MMSKTCVVVDIEDPSLAFVCIDCGSLVFDTKQHDKWHKKAGF